jgi:hypothetical protein
MEIIDGVDTTVADKLVLDDGVGVAEMDDDIDDERDAVVVIEDETTPEMLGDCDALVDGESDVLTVPLLDVVTEAVTVADLTGDRDVDGLRVSRRDTEVEIVVEGDAEKDLEDPDERDSAEDALTTTLKEGVCVAEFECDVVILSDAVCELARLVLTDTVYDEQDKADGDKVGDTAAVPLTVVVNKLAVRVMLNDGETEAVAVPSCADTEELGDNDGVTDDENDTATDRLLFDDAE